MFGQLCFIAICLVEIWLRHPFLVSYVWWVEADGISLGAGRAVSPQRGRLGTNRRSFCRNATLGNITLKGNSQSKIAFTQTLTIDGPFEVSGDATLTFACYDKEFAAQQSKAKTAPEDEEDAQDMRNEEPYTDEYSDLFHLAPNPATEKVQISMMPEACGPEAKEIFVYGLNGGLWYQSQFSYSYGIVPLENLPSGMYLVRVVWEGYSVTKKLIVQ